MGWFGRNKHVEEPLSVYLDGELDARQAETVERHLTTCDECSALLEELRGAKSLLAALPRQTPRRSFVLGAEYEQPAQPAGGRVVASPPRRPVFAFVPAMALILFAALLVVDAGGFSGSSSDDSASELTAFQANTRQAESTDGASAGGSSLAPPKVESDATGDDATGPASAEPQPSLGDVGGEAGAGATEAQAASAADSAAVTPEPDLSALSVEESPDEDEGVPEAADAVAPAGDDGGISTLRILEILAGSVFLVSAFYAIVWPRLSRGS